MKMTQVHSSPAVRARFPVPALRRELFRLVVVDDDQLGTVTVWWSRDRPAPWRCSEHGRGRWDHCLHAQVACELLIAELRR